MVRLHKPGRPTPARNCPVRGAQLGKRKLWVAPLASIGRGRAVISSLAEQETPTGRPNACGRAT